MSNYLQLETTYKDVDNLPYSSFISDTLMYERVIFRNAISVGDQK